MLSPNLARIRSFKVVPALPEPLKPLLDVAHNLWWTWHSEAAELFIRLDRDRWEANDQLGHILRKKRYLHNPVRMLGSCTQQTLDEAASDEGFLTSLERVVHNMNRHLERRPWHDKKYPNTGDFTIAYFCAEFGLTECFQIYSGGLGCLAGDHLKSASELGLPMVAVGLLYRHGYFQQYLNADGWQQELHPDLDFENLPVERVLDENGNQVKVSVQLPGREVRIAVWKVKVGRIDLYLLDTNLPKENDPVDCGITSQLYGGDMETRIKQEIVLGVGGVRALTALGIQPDVFHMNEGHSAFMGLERIRCLIDKYNISFDEARQYAAASNVFTTHTPVPAGIDRFPPDMIQRYFKDFHSSLRLDMEGLLALGRENIFAQNEFFSMAVLAIRTSDWANGVSKLHGYVSRSMWQNIWPGSTVDEVPIKHVTNGVHARSWMSGELINLLDRYLGARWQEDPADQTVWEAVNEVPDEELWRVHSRRRQQLIIWARRMAKDQLEARGANKEAIEKVTTALDPEALTIGFARRFATYKRGDLLLRDRKRLEKMLTNVDRPIQFLIAGKAHPADGGGKDLIRQIVHASREIQGGHRIIFVEDYDINVARYLLQGCDIWLNTPRRGMEASGTSGMKAALNGALNLSILDGWWDEACENELGWAIGRGETYANLETQDDIESRALYDLLEKQILPMFYDRDDHNIPREWVRWMKKCISVLAPAFNTNRMLQDYAEQFYLPALSRARKLQANNLEKSIELAHQKTRLHHQWGNLRVEEVQAHTGDPLKVRESLPVSATVRLGELSPEEVKVQAFHGVLDNDERIIDGVITDLSFEESLGDGRHRFAGDINVNSSGRHGFAIRIVPGGEMFDDIKEPGLVCWDNIGHGEPQPQQQLAEATR